MRVLLLAALAGAVLATAASAAQVRGTARADTIRGTIRADFIDPRAGRDRVSAGRGNDRIKAQDQFIDTIACGPGYDVVTADLRDRLAADCELAARQLSRDPFRGPPAQHETEVEPDSYAWGSTVMAIFQVGRIRDGAAMNNGFAISRDAGRTWRSGLLPSLTPNSRPQGRWARVSDPVIGYDAAHEVWLASSLAVSPGVESALVFNRSTDGVNWSPPVVATSSTSRELELDKQWFTCDNWATSPFRGHCYLSYSDFRTLRISVQTSTDGGLTWSAPLAAPDNAGRRAMQVGSPGVQPVVRPNGDVLVTFWDGNQMSAIRSTDGGASFSRTIRIAAADPPGNLQFRAFALPVAEVDAAGTVYLAWSDCGLRSGCSGTDLVLARSDDGVRWSAPARIPTGPVRGNTHDVLPGLGADPERAGRLALTYYRLYPGGGIDAFFVRSANGGAAWTRPRLINTETMTRSWIAQTTLGPMLGDYISTSFAAGRPVAVYALASRPDNRLREAIYGARLP
jgi:RTX calcium-binding nonapeptide repeat (4 copies)